MSDVPRAIEPIRRKQNKTEAEYDSMLAAELLAGEIREYRFEAVTLLLGVDTRYTPDFMVILANGELEFRETKGNFIREDGWQKLKIAAALYPFRFKLCQKKDGAWTTTVVGRNEEVMHHDGRVRAQKPTTNRTHAVKPREVSGRATEIGSRIPTLNGKPITDEYAKELLKRG